MLNRLLIFFWIVISQQVLTQTSHPLASERPKPPPLPQLDEEKDYFPCPETMPYPCQCKDSLDKHECRKKFMIEYIYTNITYPDSSQLLKNEGMTVVSFIIDDNAELEKIEIAKSIDKWIDEEILRVVSAMIEEYCWIAGTYCNEPSSIKFSIPVKMELKK